MADYYAVLQRTLSGFTDPKPQLRTKLYERARATIERQLTNRQPVIDDEALQNELFKLEQAIATIEQEYDPSYPDPVDGPMDLEFDDALQQIIDEEAAPEDDGTLEEPQYETSVAEESPRKEEVPAPIEAPVGEEYEELPTEPEVVEDQTEIAVEAEPTLPPASDLPQTELYAELTPVDAPALDPLSDPAADIPEEHDAANRQAPGPAPAEGSTEALMIPPAAGPGENEKRRRKGRSVAKWLFLLILLGALSATGFYGWQNRETLLETAGLSDLFGGADDDSFKPKPVKTITLKPEPAPEEPEKTADKPKNEARLGANGEEIIPDKPKPAAPTETGVEITATEPSETPVTPTNGIPAVSQNAILYEEGATASESSVDTGRVVWSVVQEKPDDNSAAEPAIRGRIEVPSRNVVLIMTIKRNTDKALPASHLIELVFAVPDDFSGGAIGQVSRFVLKESEQGRGEGLVGVPARIADGIFLIALNNLEEARKKNETLLQSRAWIDIPLQYRTGRRALMTIEKGLPGEKVFKEVFEAWNKL